MEFLQDDIVRHGRHDENAENMFEHMHKLRSEGSVLMCFVVDNELF